MVDRRLVRYVREQSMKGYSIQSIRTALIRSGYSPDITDAVLVAAQRQPRNVILVFLVLVLFLGLVISFFLLYPRDKELTPPISPSIIIQIVSSPVRTGMPIRFTFAPRGNVQSLDARMPVRFTLRDGYGSTVVSEENIFSISPGKSRNATLLLSSAIRSGTYELTVSIHTSSYDAEGRVFVDVGWNDVVPFSQNATSQQPSDVTQIKEIVALARESPAKSLQLCVALARLNSTDDCLLNSGITVRDDAFCGSIKNTNKKDTCYFNVILITKRTTLCTFISDVNLRSTCDKI